jgi:colanic acid/amylovoran biosynthesis protein
MMSSEIRKAPFKQKTILVNAFTAFNLGDDLFLKILFERYPSIQFKLIASKEYNSFCTDFPNVKRVDLYKLSFLKKALLKMTSISKKQYNNRFLISTVKNMSGSADGYINIGGSVFIQNKEERSELEWLNSRIAKEFYSKAKFIIGANFGPYKTAEFLAVHKVFFQSFDDVCFREITSYNLFKDLGNVRVAPDVVFQLQLNRYTKIEKTVGFSVIDLSERSDLKEYTKEYYSMIKNLIKLYIKRDYKVYLFSFCKIQGDEKIIHEILGDLNKIEKSNVKKVFYNGDINNFLSIYGKIDKMYCTRFHSMILSMIFGQKFYPIAYSAKMTDCLEYIGFGGEYSLITNIKQGTESDLLNLIEDNVFNPEIQVRQAQLQFSSLDKYLNI